MINPVANVENIVHKSAAITASGSPTALWTPALGNQIVLLSLFFTVKTANDTTYIYRTATNNVANRLMPASYAAGGGYGGPLPFKLGVNEVLNVLSANSDLEIHAYGYETPGNTQDPV